MYCSANKTRAFKSFCSKVNDFANVPNANKGNVKMPRQEKYRVSHLILDLGWVYFYLMLLIHICPRRIGQKVEHSNSNI